MTLLHAMEDLEKGEAVCDAPTNSPVLPSPLNPAEGKPRWQFALGETQVCNRWRNAVDDDDLLSPASHGLLSLGATF